MDIHYKLHLQGFCVIIGFVKIFNFLTKSTCIIAGFIEWLKTWGGCKRRDVVIIAYRI